jgi:type IV pilus assembly protein PilY1
MQQSKVQTQHASNPDRPQQIFEAYMSRIRNAIRNTITGITLGLSLINPALADDAEIFVGRPEDVGARPNILFVIDTSGSMDTRDSGSTGPTRMDIVRDATIDLVSSLNDVNIGLMRYSANGTGGMVIEAMDNIDTNRTTVINRLNTFTSLFGNGVTPLSETYYEAALYLRGGAIDYGLTSTPETSTAASRVSGNASLYKSPIEYQCQKNYIVYLTDGLPVNDNQANDKIAKMIHLPSCVGDEASPSPPGNGRCTEDLARYLNAVTTDLSPSQPGNQNAQTYMIGFGQAIAASVSYLDEIAAAGGTGQAYTAADAAGLATTLQAIFADIDTRSQTFVTPSISVNAFNRTQSIADLYFALFKVEETERWNGNLKKYRINGDEIVDVNNDPAVANGFFAEGSQSFWSPSSDGANILAGGAISQLDAPDARNMYTNVGSSVNLTDSSNSLEIANTELTHAALGVPNGSSERERLIRWARGYQNGDPLLPQIKSMGDPMHSQPGVVTYSGTEEDPFTVVFTATNDGFLHAFVGNEATPTGGGRELWSFIPEDLLPRLSNLSKFTAGAHSYGLDGDIRVLKYDANQDGLVNGSDYVYLFFGMRMGGSNYYALDVTDPEYPKMLWTRGPGELPGVGQTWSPPEIAKVKVNAPANTNAEKYVLIFGGGYDPTQENQPYSADSVGNRLFMLDAQSGNLLWYAGNNTGANLVLPSMVHSIPSRVNVIDLNADGYADRMYVGDMGGLIWRFDVYSDNAANNLVTGGVFANLGANLTPTVNANNRRFYNAPDVALIQSRGTVPYFNLAIGSGYRGHPLDTVTNERFYALRDKQPFTKRSAAQYASLVPILETNLVDITADVVGTAVPTSAAGWRFTVNQRAGRAGEKFLAESITINGVILVPSFQPGFTTAQSVQNPCFPVNTNRVYAFSVINGSPAIDFKDDGIELGEDDLDIDLDQSGIVGKINAGFVPQVDSDGDGIADTGNELICLAGVQVLDKCVPVDGVVRTYWERDID